MEWYFILLIVLGGLLVLCGLCLLFAFVIAKALLKAATTPVAHTFDDARDWQQKYENWDFTDYDKVWKKESFELDGVRGKIRGEVIYNDATPQGSRPKVAVICHGHTWNRLNSLKYGNIFFAKGYNLVIYDHGYFGLSDGNHTTVGDKERYDLNTVLDYTRKLFGEEALVALHGESMGAATVLLELGLRNDIDFVVADCPFSNTMSYYRELCTHLTHLPSFPIVDIANLLAKRKFGYDFKKVNPIDGVKASNTPVCFIHGSADSFIAPHHSEDMHKVSSNELSELHLFDGAEHACSHCTDKDKYITVVSEFIDKVEKSLATTEKVA
ncbi:MAG: alpha/beta hydrolase [Clostridiales bacterium]|nr:alpha/beta hydrolase [Clostridiales bacterium]